MTRSGDAVRFSAAVYLLGALFVDISYELHRLAGGTDLPKAEMMSTLLFFASWAPAAPLIVFLARRWAPERGRRLRAIDMHFSAATALAFATLLVHRIVFCPHDACFAGCVTDVHADSSSMRWFALDYFFYAAVVSGIWMFDALERTHRRTLHAIEVERDFNTAELNTMRDRIAPASLIESFRSIAARIDQDPLKAEEELMSLSDQLRKQLRSMTGVAGIA